MVRTPKRVITNDVIMDRLDAVSEQVERMNRSMDTLIRLETQYQNIMGIQNAQHTRLDGLDNRVQVLERMVPMSRTIERVVLAGAGLILAAVLTAAVTIVVRTPSGAFSNPIAAPHDK